MSMNETLQMSLIAFKERCLRQQKQMEELQKENGLLKLVVSRKDSLLSRSSAGTEHDSSEVIRQLQEANLQLRQRNLELTQALLHKDSSFSYMESLNSIRSFGTECMEDLGDEDDDDDDDDDETLFALKCTDDGLRHFKDCLLQQQKTAGSLLEKLRQNHEARGRPSEKDDRPVQKRSSDCERLCPMCEARFPEGEVSMEDFESHVLEHFSYEDRQSSAAGSHLMLDAQTSFAGDFG